MKNCKMTIGMLVVQYNIKMYGNIKIAQLKEHETMSFLKTQYT